MATTLLNIFLLNKNFDKPDIAHILMLGSIVANTATIFSDNSSKKKKGFSDNSSFGAIFFFFFG